MATLGNVGKVTEIANVAPRSLSAGQIAAVILCLAVTIIGGIGWLAHNGWLDCFSCQRARYYSRYDDDGDDESRIGRLCRAVAEKIRSLGAMAQRKEAAATSEPKTDLSEVQSDNERSSTPKIVHVAGRETGDLVLPWDESYVPHKDA